MLRFQNIHNANEHPIRLERRDKKGLHRNKRLENYVAQTQPVLLLFVVLIKFQFINQLNGDIDNIIVVGGLGPTTTHTYPMPQCARRGDRFSHIHATRARYSHQNERPKMHFAGRCAAADIVVNRCCMLITLHIVLATQQERKMAKL